MRDVEARLKISAVDRTGRVLANVGDKLSAVNARAQAFNRTQTMLGRTETYLAGQLAMLARYAGPAVLGYEMVRTTKMAGDFEESLFNIQKKSGATAEQMRTLGDEIRSLSKTDVPMPIEEIAAAFERGAAAGIPLNELKEFARLATQVADAWDVSSEDAGNFFAGFNKGLGIPLNEMKAFASLINDLADSGIADEKDVADFVDRVGASLKNFGMTPNEIAAYGAAFLNLKMPADVAARAMDTISGKLLAPENLSNKSRKALQAIVGDLKGFSKLTGNQKMMFFLEKVEKLSSQKRASLLGALLGEGFDDEIMRVVSGADELRRNLEMAEKHTRTPSNSIAGVSEKKLELFNSRLAILKNQLNDIELSLGQRTLPLAEKVVGAISKALTAQDQLNAGLTKTTADDPVMAADQKKEFRRRFKEEGLSGFKQSNGVKLADDIEYWKALKAVGRGEYKDVWSYLDDLALRKDPKGRMKDLYSQGYQPGKGPENPLGTEPGTGFAVNDAKGVPVTKGPKKVPVPVPAPTKEERAAFAITEAYKQAENFGRDTVADAVRKSKMAPQIVVDQALGAGATDAIEAQRRRKEIVKADNRRTALQAARDGDQPKAFSLREALKMDIDVGVFREAGDDLRKAGEEAGERFGDAAVNRLRGIDPKLASTDDRRTRLQNARDQEQTSDQVGIDLSNLLKDFETESRRASDRFRRADGIKSGPDGTQTAPKDRSQEIADRLAAYDNRRRAMQSARDQESGAFGQTLGDLSEITRSFEDGAKTAVDTIHAGASEGGQAIGDEA
ncbi:MAG: hypothetical protein RLZZ444_1886, partial [Pseudomonadota bacterium]